MSNTTKLKVEKWSAYSALIIIALGITTIHTILITSALHGTQNNTANVQEITDVQANQTQQATSTAFKLTK